MHCMFGTEHVLHAMCMIVCVRVHVWFLVQDDDDDDVCVCVCVCVHDKLTWDLGPGKV